eukprot:CAMPEP_0194095850 /NCGR_PEP_ID=MMETSP0149-20130528/57038_1 /TAXON_ID=122233 /ORGANISM="Chaetoceros debilis, Strain MM31A-1" /LENGTH=781 /DNA_ID=CAMNT_0038781811 /DNA_START=53 /DNA_END=2398 /DNA_ORIENTATION=+
MRTSRSVFLLCTCAFLSNSKLASVTAESANSTFQQEDGNNDPSIGIAIDNKNITESPITAAPHTSATNNPLAGDSSPAFATTGTCSNDKSFRIIRKNGTAEWCKWLEHRKKGARRRWCDKWNNGRLVKEACALSCGECSNNVPVQPPPVANSSKRGLIIGMRESERNVNHFKDAVSWFYNYSQWPSHWEGKWADANGIEFVPTIHKAYLTNRDLSPWCFFNSTQPTCSKQDAINTIRASINDRTNNGPPVANSSKRGLIIGGFESERNVNHFKDSVSWFYNYSQRTRPWEGQWADANGIEFVPMIAKDYLRKTDQLMTPLCFFNSTQPTCSKQDAINTIRASINDRTNNGVAPRYLMGFNEMYNNPPPIDLTPAEAAIFWGKYVQPAAVANGLILVSPTTQNKDTGIEWFADFLKQCCDRRFQTDPCDIEIIKRFAVHEYENCESNRFEKGYGGGSSELITGLAQQLGNYGGKNDWLTYLRNRDLWVTETNCFWESMNPHPDSKEQCLRTTGQKWQTHGSGYLAKMNDMANVERYAWWTVWHEIMKPNFQHMSTKPNYLTYFNGQLTPIGKAYLSPGNPKVDCEFPGVKLYAWDAKMNKMANVERYAWWTVWNIQTKPNYLTYRNGQLTPIGKAYLSPGNPKVDCEFPGVKLYARDATLTGTAELFTCKSTGSQMIRRGGRFTGKDGTVAFTVNVPSWGNYAINVSYLTVGARNLSVSVNNGRPGYYTFRSTSSSWCWGEGGASTVVPLELTGLRAGINTITFGSSMTSMMPLIEWISVVV